MSCGDYPECSCTEASCATRRNYRAPRALLPRASIREPWWLDPAQFMLRVLAVIITLYWVWWLL